MSKCHITSNQFIQDDISDFIKLSKVEYGDLDTVTNQSHIDWKHLNTPFGSSIAVNLKNNDDIVGRIILQPRTFYINGKERPVAFVTDALVHPDYRRPVSNFLTLITSIKNFKEFAVIFHTSNKRTKNIYSKVLKFSCPFFLKGYGIPVQLTKLLPKEHKIINLCLKIINVPYQLVLVMFLNFFKLFTTIRISSDSPNEVIFDQFCADENIKNNFLTTRNYKILKWRFKDTPLWKADILHLYQNKKYCGYVVLRQIELDDINFSVVMDFVVSSKLSKLQFWCLRCLLIGKAISNKSDIIFTLLNPKSNSSRKFLGFPFVRVPDRFLPHTTPIFVHAIDPELIAMEKEQGLHITLSDLDYF